MSLRYPFQVLESVVSRLFCQRALWQRDPQRVTKFLLLSARDQFRKRMNEQGGMVRKTIYFVDTSCGKTRDVEILKVVYLNEHFFCICFFTVLDMFEGEKSC